MVHIGNDWDNLLSSEFQTEYYLNMRKFLANEYRTRTIYPDMHDIFNALKYTSYADTKVVLLGQDPYHGEGQAHGLCFSVKEGIIKPPSLNNIFKELEADLGVPISSSGDLTRWAMQGVLLLNTVLTVRAGSPNSHRACGWQVFTDRVIELLNERKQPMVFLLWGANAKAKMQLLTNPKHKILTAAHPSPLSAYNGFFGCRHFSKANALLAQWGMEKIEW